MPRGRQSDLVVYRNHLMQRREQIDAQLQAIDQIMAGMNGISRRGAARPPARARPVVRQPTANDRQPRAGSLKGFIVQVMKGGGVMRVAEITAAIKRAGYKTKNKTLGHSVGVALREMKGVKKVGRGQFRVR